MDSSKANSFQLHPQLAADCHLLGHFQECRVLLHKNAAIPWFILVPETDVADLLDLPEDQRKQVMAECALISQFVRQQFHSSKINFGAIGNLVPQMHLHVIGRTPDDVCWPNPVWGNLTQSASYDAAAVAEVINRLKASFGLGLSSG